MPRFDNRFLLLLFAMWTFTLGFVASCSSDNSSAVATPIPPAPVATAGAALATAAANTDATVTTSGTAAAGTVTAGATVVVGTVSAGATVVSSTVTAAQSLVQSTVTTAGTTIAGTVTANITTVRIGTSVLGPVLTDARGMTLYTFGGDVAGSGASNVSGSQANSWPPLILTSGSPTKPAELTGEISTITRTDGSKQITYKGLPLYGWRNDKSPGDITGHNLSGFVVAVP